MHKLFRSFYRSRTMWASAVISALGVVQSSSDLLKLYLTPDVVGLLLIAIGVIVAVLRSITKVPLSEK